MRIPLLALLLASLLAAASFDGSLAFKEKGDDVAASCLRAKPDYIGASGCKKCHFAQWKSWKKTLMANAFETLKPGQAAEAKKKHGLDVQKDYTKDASCLACHTTGYGKPGGYPAISEGKEWNADEQKRAEILQGVQCEACHGPGSEYSVYKKKNPKYKREEIKKLGLIHPDATNCATCHNSKSPTVAKDHKFDFEKMLKDEKQIHKHRKLKHPH